MPVAINCCFLPRTMLGFVGVTEMDTSVAAVTVRVVDPDMLPLVAFTVVLPVVTLVASPALPAALDTVATVAFVEVQVAAVVKSWVELSV